MRTLNSLHRCPICEAWHEGEYQMCQRCIDDDNQEKPEYDYVGDDRNYDIAQEDRFRR